MEDSPFAALVEVFRGGDGETGLVMGRVLSWPTVEAPEMAHKVLVGGNTQERGALLRNEALGEYGLAAGDEVLLLPIEEEQRYVILCKVVAV